MTDTYDKEGGAAFPFGENRYDGGNHYLGKQYSPGMSLRDWFAGQALAGVIDICRNDTLSPIDTREALFAMRAYAIADAMIAARKQEDAQ